MLKINKEICIIPSIIMKGYNMIYRNNKGLQEISAKKRKEWQREERHRDRLGRKKNRRGN